jgi:fructokinase
VYRIGLDIGGTKIEAVLLKEVDSKSDLFLNFDSREIFFQELDRKRGSSEREKGYESYLEKTCNIINELITSSQIKLSEVTSIGIGLPGSVDPKTRQMLNGNTSLFVNKKFHKDLSEKLKIEIPIYIENDANCFVTSELYLGNIENADKKVCLGIILGTGVGCGLISKGVLQNGPNGGATEVGHTSLVFNGRDCFCGRKGCVETYLSGPALEEEYKDLTGKLISAQEIFILKDSDSKDIIDRYQRYFVEFLLNLINSFDPDFIFLGGGISNQGILLKNLENILKKQTFIKGKCPIIRKNTLGDSSGVYGAAILPMIVPESVTQS